MPERGRKFQLLWNMKAWRAGRWPKFLGRHKKESEILGALSELALHAERVEKILAASADALLQISGADRVGVWMESNSHEISWTGRVAKADDSTASAQWQSLDPSAIFREQSQQKVRSFVFRESELPFEPPGFFEGMEVALCLPLEIEGHLFGTALLASKRSRFLAARGILEHAASGIALALSFGAARQQSVVASSALKARADIDRAVAGNSSSEEILRLVGVSVVRNTGAEFAGFARMQDAAVQWAALSGSESQAASAYLALREVAASVLSESQPAIRAFPPSGNPSIWLAGLALEPGAADHLLLLAGYRSEEEVPLGLLRQSATAAVAACKAAQVRMAAIGSGQDDRQQLAGELRSLLDAVQCGVLLLDVRGYVRHANACLKDFLGLGAQKTSLIRSFDELAKLVGPMFRNPEAFAAHWNSFAEGSGEEFRDELVMTGRNRRVLAREARPVLGDSGQPIGWLEIYRDITSQRQIQSKLLQTEKMAALGQLVSGIAHELNNPLTSIMGYAQLLLGRAAPEAPSGEAKMIFEEAERARRIVKNLLFFARKAEPERMRVDINEIVERTVALRGYELKIENIAIATNLAPGLPPTLADPFQLQQVVLNLLVNAEQAILEGRGSGRIEVRTRKISPTRLGIEVSDDGPGVPPEIVSRIFDPFFTTKAPGVGTGLGLSIVYGIVEQHGGEVSFENLRTGGARFTLELPILAVPAPVSRPVPETAPRFMDRAAARVLVIEDEPTVAQLVADVLREEGHEVEAVLDSQEGLTRISRSSYDLIVCDLRMPRLDGPAFYDALVRAGSPERNRILFITGDTLGPRTVEFLKSHRLPFLAKPFLVEELKLAVNRVLEGGVSAEPPRAVSTRAT
jgi:signal transduction histidine kinase/CheY-like chemotaxis protein